MYRSSLISLIAGLTCIVALMGAPVECWQAECRVWVAIIGGSLFMAGCALRATAHTIQGMPGMMSRPCSEEEGRRR